MARIRTTKPEFYRHERLQELEKQHPGQYPMLVFSALWGHCDRQGVFEWRPRMLALDILPFLWEGSIGEALGKSLGILAENGLILHLIHDGKEYGYISSYRDHQRISGKEAQEPSRFPDVSEMIEFLEHRSNGEATGKQRGSNGEAVETAGREGKGREGNTTVVGGGVVDTACAHEEPPDHPPPQKPEGGQVEEEVQRIKALHLRVCGLNTLPPLAIVREILQRGKAATLIDDVYQTHGGDVPKYRQRNIVEALTALRDGVPARASPTGGRGKGRGTGGLSGSELRMQATFEAARVFAGGGGVDDGGG